MSALTASAASACGDCELLSFIWEPPVRPAVYQIYGYPLPRGQTWPNYAAGAPVVGCGAGSTGCCSRRLAALRASIQESTIAHCTSSHSCCKVASDGSSL